MSTCELPDGAKLQEGSDSGRGSNAEDDPEDPVPAQQEDEREDDDDRRDDAGAALQILPRTRPRGQAHSGVRNAASLALSSGDMGSLTAIRT